MTGRRPPPRPAEQNREAAELCHALTRMSTAAHNAAAAALLGAGPADLRARLDVMGELLRAVRERVTARLP